MSALPNDIGLVARIEERVLAFAFTVSDQPILFRELLKINKMHEDGTLEGKMPGFRVRLWRLYLLFFALWNIILLPASIILHPLLAKIDCHLAIVMATLMTLLFFSTFSLFHALLVERISIRLIKRAWAVHFPYFGYEQHRQELAMIYAKAEEQEIARKDLRLFVLNSLLHKEQPADPTA